jgi:hypothetical protein
VTHSAGAAIRVDRLVANGLTGFLSMTDDARAKRPRQARACTHPLDGWLSQLIPRWLTHCLPPCRDTPTAATLVRANTVNLRTMREDHEQDQ